jgi:hypothetical protein
LFGECMCNHCFDCSLVSALTNETQVSSPVTHTMWSRNSSPSLWYRSKKVKPKAILCILCWLMSIFGTHLMQNLWQPSLTVIISYRTVHEICRNSHESSEIVKCCHSQIVWAALWTRSLLTTDGQPLRSSLWTCYTTVL